MKIEALTAGLSVSFYVRIKEQRLKFDSLILEVYPKKKLVLAEAVYKNDKIISLRGNRILVDMLVTFLDEKPQLFQNVTVLTVKKTDGTLCYSLACATESKPYNRRGSFRCYVGISTSIQAGSNRAAKDAIIRDVSASGFSIVCESDVELLPGQIVHAVLNDYINDSAENFSFHLYGLVSRIQELENGKFLYGCRLNNTIPGLEQYIIKKERLRLRLQRGEYN